MVEVTMKTAQEVADELAELENQMLWSKEDQGRWRVLVWVLGLDREPPWEGDDGE